VENNVLFKKDRSTGEKTLVYYPIGRSDTSYTAPDDVTCIGDSAFAYSTLTEITLPAKLTKIDFYAFWGAANLTSVEIPDKTETIEYGAFLECTSLAAVTLPHDVKYIYNEAFDKCSEGLVVTYLGNAEDWKNVNCYATLKEGCLQFAVTGSTSEAGAA
jgi:hypothetical protein